MKKKKERVESPRFMAWDSRDDFYAICRAEAQRVMTFRNLIGAFEELPRMSSQTTPDSVRRKQVNRSKERIRKGGGALDVTRPR